MILWRSVCYRLISLKKTVFLNKIITFKSFHLFVTDSKNSLKWEPVFSSFSKNHFLITAVIFISVNKHKTASAFFWKKSVKFNFYFFYKL
jgi:hypothetical protein